MATKEGLNDREAPHPTRMAVAIVNHQTRAHLQGCLWTVLSESPVEIIVVDNASTDGSADMARHDFPGVHVFENRENRGYGAAANQAISRCRADYVLLLNSDVRLEPGALSSMSAYLDDHPRAALVGPRLAFPDGTLQKSCFPLPTVLNTFLWEDTYGWAVRYVPLARNRYRSNWPHDASQIVPWVLGAAMAIRRAAWEDVGGFDEDFFMYSEEVDLCYRLARAGWEVHFAPLTTVIHFGGASTSQRRVEMAVQRFASHMKFARRHYSWPRLAMLVVVVKLIALFKLITESCRWSTTRQRQRRDRAAQNVAIWQRVLRGHWRAG